MKKLSVVAAFLMLASCGHNPVAELPTNLDRMPSSTKEVNSCGLLGSTETVRNAVDFNDRLLTLEIACKNGNDVAVGIPMNQIHPSQKGWITRWRKSAVKSQRNPAAKPYLCMSYQAEFDPCVANKNVLGVAPLSLSKANVKKVK